MDQNIKVCISNIAFSACSMGIFLFTRHRVLASNAFRTSLSPLCRSLLHYESKSKIISSNAYLKKLSLYLAIQSSLVLISGSK